MGTNYYMLTKNKKLREQYFNLEDDWRFTDEPKLGYEIHICKQSSGWKTLFQSHDNAYKSVKEFENFIREHKEDFIFYDEYCREYDIEDFLKQVKYFDRDENGNIRKRTNGKLLICHEEYYKEHKYEYPFIKIEDWQDEDGYDFTERWFG